MAFLTNDKLVIVGAAGMIGSNMAQTAAMLKLSSVIRRIIVKWSAADPPILCIWELFGNKVKYIHRKKRILLLEVQSEE